MVMKEHHDLKKTGLKATLPRLKVLNIFENNRDKHLSAEDIFKIMLKTDEEVGLATIYRVLTQFEQSGILIRHHFESDKAVFELNEKDHHDHIVCLQCGFIKEFCDDEIEKRQNMIAEKNGFTIIEHALYIYADCNNKSCACKLSGAENIAKCHGLAK
jgi:Fur family ferric uptake transcriptional regulator